MPGKRARPVRRETARKRTSPGWHLAARSTPPALGKSNFGLADSQARHYTPICRHLALAMAALAVCAVTAALARPRTAALARPPTSPGELPPEDPGLIPLTVTEIKRIFNLITPTQQTIRHHLRWSWWRRRHQARARWFHHRARLRKRQADP